MVCEKCNGSRYNDEALSYIYKSNNIVEILEMSADEPTTGLHASDIKEIMKVLERFVLRGNTVIVIEHNLYVIKQADYIIDMPRRRK